MTTNLALKVFWRLGCNDLSDAAKHECCRSLTRAPFSCVLLLNLAVCTGSQQGCYIFAAYLFPFTLWQYKEHRPLETESSRLHGVT